MKNKKKNQEKKKTGSFSLAYPLILFIATLFMGFGYAAINSITSYIKGDAVAVHQNGIFITDVSYEEDLNADLDYSKILNMRQTTVSSKIVLSSENKNSFITYKVTVYNGTSDNYIFEDVKYILGDQTYDNEDIKFELIGLKKDTLLAGKSSLNFYIKFYYDDIDKIDNNVLNSYLNFSFVVAPYIVTFDTNMNYSEYTETDGFTIEEVTEAGDTFYRASFNKTTGTSDEWYYISFPSYSYKVGSTYKIRMKTRVQSAMLDFGELRHAAIENDWGTEGREYIQFTNDELGVWKEQVLTRTFNTSTLNQGGANHNLSPRVEIYTSNLTLAGGITNRSLTFDYKDVYVSEIITLEKEYGEELGEIPTPTRSGYVFAGWYTQPEGGIRVNSSTILTDKNVTYYAHWFSSSDKGIVTFDTNMNYSEYTETDGFTIEEVTEAGDTFYRASFNKTTGTSDEWYYISFPSYSYKVGSTYKIRMKTRVQSAMLDFAELRHAAIENDWGTNGREYVQFTSDEIGVWKEQVLTRTFNTSRLNQGGANHNLSPRVEIYTSNLTLAGGITNRSLTFDYKDVYVSEITTKELNYGSALGTLPTPTRSGYEFKGWYTQPDGGSRVTSTSVLNTETPTYYARWVKNNVKQYSVTYVNFENNNYPNYVVEGENLVVDMSDTLFSSLIIKINDSPITDYTYENRILTVYDVHGNITIEGIKETDTSYFIFDEPTNTILGIIDKGYDQELIIPEEINGVPVKAISDNAFSYNSNITRVVIPEGVTTIGESAFRDCYNVTEFVIPNTVITIGDNAFREARSITELVIPDSVLTIGIWAFAGCSSLETVTIGSGVISIGEATFSYDPSLKTINIASGSSLEIPSDRWGANNSVTIVKN